MKEYSIEFKETKLYKTTKKIAWFNIVIGICATFMFIKCYILNSCDDQALERAKRLYEGIDSIVSMTHKLINTTKLGIAMTLIFFSLSMIGGVGLLQLKNWARRIVLISTYVLIVLILLQMEFLIQLIRVGPPSDFDIEIEYWGKEAYSIFTGMSLFFVFALYVFIIRPLKSQKLIDAIRKIKGTEEK